MHVNGGVPHRPGTRCHNTVPMPAVTPTAKVHYMNHVYGVIDYDLHRCCHRAVDVHVDG